MSIKYNQTKKENKKSRFQKVAIEFSALNVENHLSFIFLFIVGRQTDFDLISTTDFQVPTLLKQWKNLNIDLWKI